MDSNTNVKAFCYLLIIIVSLAENSLVSLKRIHLCEERDAALEQQTATILSCCEIRAPTISEKSFLATEEGQDLSV